MSDRFRANAVCQKIVGLYGQQALTAYAAQILEVYEAQLAIAGNLDDDINDDDLEG